MIYECNRKHKEPWQRGRKGSLCPREITQAQAQALLAGSILDGRKRYGTHAGKAYCAQCHQDERWHGYPVAWREVPDRVRHILVDGGLVTRTEIKGT
jgi:hypothetical protein